MDWHNFQESETVTEYGTFYGIGVGPGDPELMTIKAQKVLQKAQYVFTPIAGEGRESIAHTIARQFIAPDATVAKLLFPMIRDKALCEKSWEENAHQIASVLRKGNDATFLTLGDPMTYSTYGYLLQKMEVLYPQVKAVTIPGIPSYLAVAAASNLPLVEGSEILTLIPGNTPPEKIKEFLSTSDTILFLKHHRNAETIYNILQEVNLDDKALYVSRCGFEEHLTTKKPTKDFLDKPDYLSLIIVKK
jgi:precorrin-2/cobalt-factor-2 C20-methyltransferase